MCPPGSWLADYDIVMSRPCPGWIGKVRRGTSRRGHPPDSRSPGPRLDIPNRPVRPVRILWSEEYGTLSYPYRSWPCIDDDDHGSGLCVDIDSLNGRCQASSASVGSFEAGRFGTAGASRQGGVRQRQEGRLLTAAPQVTSSSRPRGPDRGTCRPEAARCPASSLTQGTGRFGMSAGELWTYDPVSILTAYEPPGSMRGQHCLPGAVRFCSIHTPKADSPLAAKSRTDQNRRCGFASRDYGRKLAPIRRYEREQRRAST